MRLTGNYENRKPEDSPLLGFWRRVLQLHLCVIYFFSGLTKCLGSGWWDGSNVWRALIRPPFNVVDPEMLVRWKYLFPVAGIFICFLEIGYPFFIWSDKTRKIWLIGICAMHAGIGLMMGMYLFALIMIILNVAAFGSGFVRFQGEERACGPRRLSHESRRESGAPSPQVFLNSHDSYLLSTTTNRIVRFVRGERARHARGTDA